MFSARVPPQRHQNRLARAVQTARASGRPLVNLTVTNPTEAGFEYSVQALAPLASPQGLVYTPAPLGLDAARVAVAGEYATRGLAVDPHRIVLTASTSEAYSLLFKLLCDPGDAVLVPAPSYPLFEHLTQLDGVRARTYALEYHGRWCLDAASLDRIWTHDVRAVLGVSPNNPTGSVLSPAELREIDGRCAAHGAAFILDEVFADYPLDAGPAPTPGFAAAGSEPAALTFRLGGLSKSGGLPQLKLGWMALEGPTDLVAGALERLELICDTYLSVATPVQIAAGDLIRMGAGLRRQIHARVVHNYRVLQDMAATRPSIDVLHADAGWSAVVRVPAVRSEEDLVLDLLERDGVLVHPGFFFDFPREAFVVISLLPEPAPFAEAVARLLDRVHA